jgi:hypothetical protein
MRDVDHEHGQMRTVIHRPFIDTHEVFQTPVLFGITAMKLPLATPTIVVDQSHLAPCPITAEQHHMRRFVRVQSRLHDHDNVEQVGKRLRP